MQRCRFIMDYMRVTQPRGRSRAGSADFSSYSHAGSYALDLGGRDAGADWAYAPCDVQVKRVYGRENAVWFESVNEVMCADGKARKLVFLLKHIDTADMEYIGIVPGRIFRQGEKFYKEGSEGTIGNHIHLEVGAGPFSFPGWQKTAMRNRVGANVWKINNQLRAEDVFFVSRRTVVLDGGDCEWKTDDRQLESLDALTDENTRLKGRVDSLSRAMMDIGDIVRSAEL